MILMNYGINMETKNICNNKEFWLEKFGINNLKLISNKNDWLYQYNTILYVKKLISYLKYKANKYQRSDIQFYINDLSIILPQYHIINLFKLDIVFFENDPKMLLILYNKKLPTYIDIDENEVYNIIVTIIYHYPEKKLIF